MANLENNNDNENKKSVPENIGDKIQHTAENVSEKVQETVKSATQLASDTINHPLETAKEFGEQAAKDEAQHAAGQPHRAGA